jgi:hypothetical protein
MTSKRVKYKNVFWIQALQIFLYKAAFLHLVIKVTYLRFDLFSSLFLIAAITNNIFSQ